MFTKDNNLNAFTLVEILIVIAILAILAVITLAALNPAARIQAANDTQTRSSVDGLCTAISLYTVDNTGDLPTTTDPSAGSALPAVADIAATITGGVEATTLEGMAAYIDVATVQTANGNPIYVGAAPTAGQVICAADLSDGTDYGQVR